MSKCLDDFAFIVLLLSHKVFLARTAVYCCSRVGKPDLQLTGMSIGPYYGCVCNGLDDVRGMQISLSLMPFWVLAFLTTSFGPPFYLDVSYPAAVFALGICTCVKHYVWIFSG